MSIQRQVLKYQLEQDFDFFVRYVFKNYRGSNFRMQDFHKEIINTLVKVYSGEISRLIINIPPRHGKTELVKMFIAWIMAKNPAAKNIVLSYSDDLAQEISAHARNYLMSEPVNKLFKTELVADTKSKSNWMTTANGEVYSAPTAGQVTGKGAGIIGSTGGEGGVLIMDDPLKSADALYENRRKHVNELYWEVVKSRLNGQQTPIIIIMQRLHEDDLTGHLLMAQPDKWHHLKIPVERPDGSVLWEDVYDKEEAESDKRSRATWYAGQMLQEPAPAEGGIWKKDWFDIVEKKVIPLGIKLEMFVDGAYTKDTKNDPTGILIAGTVITKDGGKQAYIIHNESVWMEMPELIRHIQRLFNKFSCKLVLVEPKASGKSLKQLLVASGTPCREIRSRWAQKAKEEKAHDVAPTIEGGLVKLQKGNWNDAYLHEIATFPNSKHDEAIDNTSYALERYLLRKKVKVY